MKSERITTIILIAIVLLVGGYVAYGLANYEPNPIYEHNYYNVRHSDGYIYTNAPRQIAPLQYPTFNRSVIKAGGIILVHPTQS